MRQRTTRILVIISALIVFPLGAYIIYQVSNANENEEIISGIYEEQLKTVLFSVNQYSNDFMSALMDLIENSYQPSDPEFDPEVKRLISKDGYRYYAVHSMDSTGLQELVLSHNIDELDQERINQFIKSEEKTINQLTRYKAEGYRKMEPAGTIELNQTQYQVIMVVLEINLREYLFVGLLNPLEFVKEVLNPKMRQFASEQLVLTLQKKNSQEILFATDDLTNDFLVTSKLWLFPDYLLGVSPTSFTLQDLIDQRLRSNLIILGLLLLFISSGIALIIRNIQREAKLNQTKSEFVSNVSHELRTPLALIKMFSETLLLGRARTEEKRNEYLEIIFKETNRLTNIVNRILNFSRIEANKRVYQMETFDLTALVEEIARDYSYHLESNDCELELDVPDKQVNIEGDREAIYEAMIILIDNAMKYSDEEKHISISLFSGEKSANLSVTDKGIGIASDRIDHIFDKFYRVSDNDKYMAQGTGLGLSILKHIMDAHHSEISVSSKLGEGSTFTLNFRTHG